MYYYSYGLLISINLSLLSSEYWKLLELTATTKLNLSDKQESTLGQCFQLDQHFDKILPTCSPGELDKIFEMLPYLLAKPSLRAVSSVMVQTLINVSFDSHSFSHLLSSR